MGGAFDVRYESFEFDFRFLTPTDTHDPIWRLLYFYKPYRLYLSKLPSTILDYSINNHSIIPRLVSINVASFAFIVMLLNL